MNPSKPLTTSNHPITDISTLHSAPVFWETSGVESFVIKLCFVWIRWFGCFFHYFIKPSTRLNQHWLKKYIRFPWQKYMFKKRVSLIARGRWFRKKCMSMMNIFTLAEMDWFVDGKPNSKNCLKFEIEEMYVGWQTFLIKFYRNIFWGVTFERSQFATRWLPYM